jgi:hypothetical protein
VTTFLILRLSLAGIQTDGDSVLSNWATCTSLSLACYYQAIVPLSFASACHSSDLHIAATRQVCCSKHWVWSTLFLWREVGFLGSQGILKQRHLLWELSTNGLARGLFLQPKIGRIISGLCCWCKLHALCCCFQLLFCFVSLIHFSLYNDNNVTSSTCNHWIYLWQTKHF